ncbi:AlkZ family DNA glycosylase [Actinocrinis puniceicyclus]|uniref:AlkZ family DNA glycosylase n=1 Tax=Actinocrinis puniceicyclus TaxID=977794 RepID=A0A8J7WQ16_9ACTN|nr:winged helix DNA-binding domain-containing protein [Actinocrinis puniceicyclus]MBS2966403.1 AlkZ family DNA glycosylase [Actinocrinis puniceicyclus]
MTGTVLTARAAGRATLARQHLLERHAGGALEEIAHLAGMQAQAPLAPYTGLWARLHGFTHDELSALYHRRQVVRIALMRGTIHLVACQDALAWRPLVDPVIARATQAAFGRHYRDLDQDTLAEAARELTETAPRTFAQLGALLEQRFPGRDPAALAQAARARLPLVQIPPRGVWRAGGAIAHTTTRAWLGRDPVDKPDVEAMVRRYLAAFGPAGVMDAQAWSGLTRLREVFDRLRPHLAVLRGESGAELFDLPEAPRPDPDTPAPARFLPEYDNLLFSHAERGRVNPHGRGVPLFPGNGSALGYILLDGVYAGLWRAQRPGGAAGRGAPARAGGAQRALLTIRHFGALPAGGREQLTGEGLRLLGFLAPQATPEIAFAPAT